MGISKASISEGNDSYDSCILESAIFMTKFPCIEHVSWNSQLTLALSHIYFRLDNIFIVSKFKLYLTISFGMT